MTGLPRRTRSPFASSACLVAGAALLLTGAALPAQATDTETPADALARKMSSAVTGESAWRHLKEISAATEANGGHRDTGSPGYDAAADYLTRTLKAAGYKVQRQEVSFRDFDVITEKASVTGPASRELSPILARFSVPTPEGGLTAALTSPSGKSTGCAADDYAGADVKGRIVLVDNGECVATKKQMVASEAGAAAVLMNVNSPNRTLNLRYHMVPPEDARIPMASLNTEEAEQLKADMAKGEVTVTADLRGKVFTNTGYNVLADTPTGRADNTVVMGAHLDTVTTTSGMNDNGAASAALLENAVKMAPYWKNVRNRVRFAWWTAEERGLSGAQGYVNLLSEEERRATALYLNLEMIASPNFVRFVYNGRTPSGDPAPAGSEQITAVINKYFGRQNLPTAEMPLDGRSDHAPFTAAGIPAGGVNAGIDTIKTPEQARVFGGTAGEMLDHCYHQACDDLSNVNRTIFDQNSRAMAWAVGRFAVDTSDVNGRTARATATR